MCICIMIGQIFMLLCKKMIAFEEMWGPTFEEQQDQDLGTKNHGNSNRIKFVSTPLTGHMADRFHVVFRPNYNYHERISEKD